ncbi:hypothetical protein HMPREF9370_0550 [Neisseria wadsworthii 9715]|uniref:Uncharacterized protein n=1 Tax=Neisseria wadsworthii 9715 TaxID=1030841 RepID=G4CN91_9NEIS|nr:hypothetical protein HMPREF9370_0550 [Neisseria wadsworthii 9715]
MIQTAFIRLFVSECLSEKTVFRQAFDGALLTNIHTYQYFVKYFNDFYNLYHYVLYTYFQSCLIIW